MPGKLALPLWERGTERGNENPVLACYLFIMRMLHFNNFSRLLTMTAYHAQGKELCYSLLNHEQSFRVSSMNSLKGCSRSSVSVVVQICDCTVQNFQQSTMSNYSTRHRFKPGQIFFSAICSNIVQQINSVCLEYIAACKLYIIVFADLQSHTFSLHL